LHLIDVVWPLPLSLSDVTLDVTRPHLYGGSGTRSAWT
jgi:hypothetical protein